MNASVLLEEMSKKEAALNYFLKKDYVEGLTNQQVYVLKNCDIELEYFGVDGRVYDVMDRAYFYVYPDVARNVIIIEITIINGREENVVFTIPGYKAVGMINDGESFSAVEEYDDKTKYRLTIKKA